jgi:hypothetical protein
LSSSPARSFTFASSSAAGTTWCTNPTRSASAAPKRSPVSISSRARRSPMRRSTYGEMSAGTMPRRTSVNPKRASSPATAMSHAQAKPTPPP